MKIGESIATLAQYGVACHGWNRSVGKLRSGILRRQERDMRAQAAWVRAHSRFYARWSGGSEAAAWREWPIVDRATLMANFEEWNTAGLSLAVAEEAAQSGVTLRGGLVAGMSSGTSGRGRGIFVTNGPERRTWAGTVLARVLPRAPWGSQRVALFLRANNALYEATARSRGLRFEFFPIDGPGEEVISRLEQYAPTVIAAPPRVLARLAKDFHGPDPERVIAVAETLDPIERGLIAARFGEPVHEIYQATEGFLGATCPHGTMHLNEDNVIVEKAWLDRDAGRFVPVVTDIRRRTQPVVRLRLDDVLVDATGPCSCGSGFASIARVEGRLDDVWIFPPADGSPGWRPVFAEEIREVFQREARGVDHRARQVAPDRVEVILDTISPVRPDLTAALVRLIEDRGGRRPVIAYLPGQLDHPPHEKLRRLTRAFPTPSDALNVQSVER